MGCHGRSSSPAAAATPTSIVTVGRAPGRLPFRAADAAAIESDSGPADAPSATAATA